MLILSLLSHGLSAPRRADVDFGGGGGAVRVEPVTVGSVSAAEQLPAIDPSPKFLFFHHPRQWRIAEVDGQTVFLPTVQQVAVEPGIGNVDEFGDPAMMITQRRRGGWLLLPEEWAKATDTPDGAAGYVRRIRARKGFVHLSAWQSVRILAGSASWRVDEAGYHRWLLRLLSEGLIPPPEPEVVEGMLERARERVQRAGSRDVRGNASAAALLERAERTLAGMEQAQGAGVEELERAREASLEAQLQALRARRG